MADLDNDIDNISSLDEIFDGLYRTYTPAHQPERPLYLDEAKTKIQQLMLDKQIEELVGIVWADDISDKLKDELTPYLKIRIAELKSRLKEE